MSRQSLTLICLVAWGVAILSVVLTFTILVQATEQKKTVTAQRVLIEALRNKSAALERLTAALETNLALQKQRADQLEQIAGKK